MLNIYIKPKDVPKNDFVDSVDTFFSSIMYSLPINKKDKEYITQIDKAEYIDNGRIKTVFGDTTVEHLSTGCKTLILLNHYKNKVISINECGENALDYIYKLPEGSIYMDFAIYPHEYNPQKKVILIKNGKKYNLTLSEVFNRIDD